MVLAIHLTYKDYHHLMLVYERLFQLSDIIRQNYGDSKVCSDQESGRIGDEDAEYRGFLGY